FTQHTFTRRGVIIASNEQAVEASKICPEFKAN
ncbi:MAG: hypothetical protein ACJAQT_002206, partial [Akkermansiaceae bacterium]